MQLHDVGIIGKDKFVGMGIGKTVVSEIIVMADPFDDGILVGMESFEGIVPFLFKLIGLIFTDIFT